MITKPPKTLRKEATYPHPVERVWAALTDPDALAQWLMPNNFAPIAGHEFEFRVDPAPFYSGIVRCRVVEIDPPRRMVWTWATCPRPGSNKPPLPPMRIEWSLTALSPQSRGTRLTLTQTGLEGQPWLFNFMMASGWSTMMKRWLPRVLDAFTDSPAGPVYHRLDKAPNRGHHRTRTVPADFHK